MSYGIYELRLSMDLIRTNWARLTSNANKKPADFGGVTTCHCITTMQGLFVPFARVGSGDPVRVLRLLHNKYTGYN